jgi:hypothetical protein
MHTERRRPPSILRPSKNGAGEKCSFDGQLLAPTPSPTKVGEDRGEGQGDSSPGCQAMSQFPTGAKKSLRGGRLGI